MICSSFLSPTVLSFYSFHGLVVWCWGFGLIECPHSLPALHSRLHNNNNNNNRTQSKQVPKANKCINLGLPTIGWMKLHRQKAKKDGEEKIGNVVKQHKINKSWRPCNPSIDQWLVRWMLWRQPWVAEGWWWMYLVYKGVESTGEYVGDYNWWCNVCLLFVTFGSSSHDLVAYHLVWVRGHYTMQLG